MNLDAADINNGHCFAHGGRWADYLEEHGTMPLDFSANTSPLGMPGGAKVAAIAALQHADRYPDPHCRELRRALADHYALNKDEILVGNGAGDLIDRLALALRPRRALVTAPTFSEYRAAFERVGCYIEQHPLAEKNDFVVDEGILKRIDDTLDVLVLCEPNNPTGRTTEPALLERIARRCDQMGTFLLVDECFGDFLDEPAAHSMLPGIKAHRMLVLRAFTKFYGMAGLRLGWCACHAHRKLGSRHSQMETTRDGCAPSYGPNGQSLPRAFAPLGFAWYPARPTTCSSLTKRPGLPSTWPTSASLCATARTSQASALVGTGRQCATLSQTRFFSTNSTHSMALTHISISVPKVV